MVTEVGIDCWERYIHDHRLIQEQISARNPHRCSIFSGMAVEVFQGVARRAVAESVQITYQSRANRHRIPGRILQEPVT